MHRAARLDGILLQTGSRLALTVVTLMVKVRVMVVGFIAVSTSHQGRLRRYGLSGGGIRLLSVRA